MKLYYLHLSHVVTCVCARCYPDGPPDHRRLGEAPFWIVGPFNMSLSKLERRLKAAGYRRRYPESPQWYHEDETSLTICEGRTSLIVDAKSWLDRECASYKRRMSYRAKLRGMKEGDPYPEW